ncbi:hypothetical protein Tco_0336892 [Tanacetum coccineum]
MTMRQKAVFECLHTPHAHDFLLAIRTDEIGQHMSPMEYHIILKYRLVIPLFLVYAICLVCRKACLDSFEEHAVHCKEILGFKYRHDIVRDVLFDICRCAGISAKNEAHVGGKDACVDFIRVSPLVRDHSYGQRYYACPNSKPGTTERGCGYFMWMDASPGPSTPQSHSPGTSSRPSHSPGTSSRPSHFPRFAQNLGMAECSNCRFLAERIKTLEARISVLEGQLEMERHPENHTLESAGILHEIYQGMRNLNME